ncbi:serine/threonine protein kinase [Shouchella clausii]|uniref:Serine/threonine protein kinase n=1 Tax=Shouchella clausii TaxID=79880 RepID=A0A268RXJ5_SHOCL|nr:serine/threonine protein kinase [Shouchella clausii]PAD43224.1 serine/threonine protein kinase [Bacillus sp. 7520-S]PAF15094.1 serine/threonine protein kinase [Shouchella clausii]PAF24983.1 serine/threonine protein kinase [Shouchella clausii]GIN12081.1 putative serine/threonine-protein kinase YrzF [Shouchella clausii]
MNAETSTIYRDELAHIVFVRKGRNIALKNTPANWELIGKGRSAYVFKIIGEQRAIKVFYPPFEHLAMEEARNYEKVAGISFFPRLYEAGEGYLVMDFISGKTFFDCLAEGVAITKDHVAQVDKALELARRAGLNPSDIHLHNLLLTETGTVRLIDIARFSQKKQCTQWQDLKRGYERHYGQRYFPKRVPKWLMMIVAYFYQLRKRLNGKQ